MVKCPQVVPFFGTSRKGFQSLKGGLVSASSLVLVSGFFFCFFFILVLGSKVPGGEEIQRFQKVLPKVAALPFL